MIARFMLVTFLLLPPFGYGLRWVVLGTLIIESHGKLLVMTCWPGRQREIFRPQWTCLWT